uniref:MADF domain-containing protein n=1 Tax=Homalodisca liturata TaxID=320908 RepID=A0A1B6HF93_9HEMI
MMILKLRYALKSPSSNIGLNIIKIIHNLKLFNPGSGDEESILPVPDCEVIRKLYGIPLEEQPVDVKVEVIKEDKFTVDYNVEEIVIDNSGKSNNRSNFVWLGQRSKDCQEATKALIELYGSEENQLLMNDKHTIKQKIWEKIAIDIESRGYKIANNRRDAGLRTFQKWRNMERTYWKYLKNPCIFGEDKRRKKPSFFDGVHSVISKRNCYRMEEPPRGSSVVEPKVIKERDSSSSAIETLLKLLDTDKYQTLLHGDAKKIWKNLCSDLELKGFLVKGDTVEEKCHNISQIWKKMKKTLLQYEREKHLRKDCNKPKYYDLLFKTVSKELMGLKSYEEDVNERNLQTDHDYEGTFQQKKSVSVVGETVSTDPAASSPRVAKGLSNDPTLPKTPAPTSVPTSSTEKTDQILLEIKNLHETALAAQQQSFTKIISVLEEQAGHLKSLNTMFSQYVINNSMKSRSRHNHNSKSRHYNNSTDMIVEDGL